MIIHVHNLYQNHCLNVYGSVEKRDTYLLELQKNTILLRFPSVPNDPLLGYHSDSQEM